MRAARITAPRTVEVVERERPSPGAGEALVRVRACGICGSDLHLYGAGDRPPFTPGHEFCGEVVAVGEGVSAIEPGRRVAVNPVLHCGRCAYCADGAYNRCPSHGFLGGARQPGGMAELIAVPAGALFPLPDGLSWEEGALIEPLAVSLRGVALAGVGMGDSVAVLGAGTIGLTAVLAARAAGAEPVLAAVRYEHQAEAALRCGATHIVRAGTERLRDAVKRLTGGRGADAVIDSVGARAEDFNDALAALRRGGVLSVVGLPWAPVAVDMMDLVLRELRVVGSICYAMREHRHDFQRAIDLVASGRVRLDGLVTHRFPLAEAAAAFRTAADKRSRAIKVQVLP